MASLNISLGISLPAKVVRQDTHAKGFMVYGSDRDLEGHALIHKLHFSEHGLILGVSLYSSSSSITQASIVSHEPFSV
ncbi:hypothetical protein D3C76_927080 [compost metagenome]